MVQVRKTFFHEAEEILEESEDLLLRLENNPDDGDALQALFRGIHTIKGSAGAVNLTNLSGFVHEVEALLHPLREGQATITSEMIDALLQAQDVIAEMLEAANRGDETLPDGVEQIVTTLRLLRGEAGELEIGGEGETRGQGERERGGSTEEAGSRGAEMPPPTAYCLPPTSIVYEIAFRLAQSAFFQGLDPLMFLRSLIGMGTLSKVTADLSALPPLEEMDPESCYLGFTLWLETAESQEAIEEVFVFTEGEGEVTIVAAPDPNLSAGPVNWPLPALDPALLETFREDAWEQLEAIEAILLQVEAGNSGSEEIEEIFRRVHTLKGNADYLGLRELTRLAHELEQLLQGARDGELAVDAGIVGILFDGLDLLKEWVRAAGHAEASPSPVDPLLERIAHLQGHDGVEPRHNGNGDEGAVTPWQIFREAAEQHYEAIRYSLEQLAEPAPLDGAANHNEILLRSLHSLRSAAAFVGQQEIIALAQRLEGQAPLLSKDPELASAALAAEVPALRTLLDHKEVPAGGSDLLGDILVEKGKVTPEDVEQALAKQKPLGKLLVEEGKLSRKDVGQALVEQRRRRSGSSTSGGSRTSTEVSKTLRVDQGKVDDLMNLIGELIVAKNTLAHQVRLQEEEAGRRNGTRGLKEITAILNRISNNLQGGVMALRMVPVQTVFRRFPRLVRDLSRRSGKKIDLQIVGEETALDKTVIESLADPLVHLVRNSCDHGIESPEERRRAGKSETGQVILQARQQGNVVFIEVIDDGGGIDQEAVLDKALAKGIITADEAERMSEQDKLRLIFAPGLSTAEEVSEVSGRGVGMDVVSNNIRKLGGVVTIHSDLGQGTKMQIELPLTLAAQDVLLLEDRGETFAFPMDAIVETVKVMPEEVKPLRGQQVISWRGDVIGISWLSDLLSLNGTDKHSGRRGDDLGQIAVIVTRAEGGRSGIAVDRLLIQQEAVIKPLPSGLGHLPGLAAATVMGDGSIVLILDPGELMSLAMGEKNAVG